MNEFESYRAMYVKEKLQLRKKEDPEFKERSADIKYHEVISGDTMYSIARKYNMSVQELIELNDKTGVSLSVGEKLRINK